ncbi:asparagine synthase-related protein [Sphingobium yanoikuyae]|nr:asparagine synthetase B family protein [Sphingobium yanoikuyae]
MNTRYSIILRRGGPMSLEDIGAAEELAITCSADLEVQRFHHDGVILLGDCFSDMDAPRGLEIAWNDDPMLLVRNFVQAHWGRFVMIVQSPVTHNTVIYRDPSGMIPCYYASDEHRVAIGTEAAPILQALDITPRIDWKSIANGLMAPDLRRHQTCLQDVTEVLPGEMVILDQDGSHHHHLLWNPADFVNNNLQCDFEQASCLLKDALCRVMSTWIQRYPNPLISVSGGFDSSILAALSAQHGPVGLIHFYTASPLADERIYAAALADHLEYSISPTLMSPQDMDVAINLSVHRPRPSARSFTQIFDLASAQRAATRDHSAHFNGGGGDNVFGKLHSAYPLADRYSHTGFSRALASTAKDICAVTGTSLPMVLRQAFKACLRQDMLVPWPIMTDLLTPLALSMQDIDAHPWLNAAHGAPPGARQHVRSIARATASTDHLNIFDDRPTIYPLLSQPILELCLSFPTWFWFTGGRDRALARAAMEPFLPPLLTGRAGKGAFDGLLHQIWILHRDTIIDDLQNGCLADHGLVDRDAIGMLGTDRGVALATPTRILHLHEMEIWCRAWS